MQVDVFTAQAYLGNALAVVLDGEGLSEDAMQRFACWTNLSETTFLLPPTPEAAAAGADYQVRIFAPGYEMPFAGHPTLGSCHAWLQAGGVPRDPARVVQQCKAGLVAISRMPNAASPGGQRLAFAAPPLVRRAPTPEASAALAAALGLQHRQILAAQHLCNGPQHFGFLVDDTSTVLALEPDLAALARLMPQIGISGVGLAAVAHAPSAPGLIGRSNREARAFESLERECIAANCGRAHGGSTFLFHYRTAGHRRPGHWQLQRQPGAVVDRRRPAARPVHCLARPEHRPRRPGACAARRRRPSLGGR